MARLNDEKIVLLYCAVYAGRFTDDLVMPPAGRSQPAKLIVNAVSDTCAALARRPKGRPENYCAMDHSAENSHYPPPMGERMPLMLRESKTALSPSPRPQSPAQKPKA